jgi:hypothetical protein
MNRQMLSRVCIGLLCWAGFNDILAAQTANIDENIAAAADNDCIQSTTPRPNMPTDAKRFWPGERHVSSQVAHASGIAQTNMICRQAGSSAIADPLYQFMSLQR